MEDQRNRADDNDRTEEESPVERLVKAQEVTQSTSTASVSNVGDTVIHQPDGEHDAPTPPPPPNASALSRASIQPSGDRWMTFLTAVIAVATIGNVFVFWLESESTSKDMKTLSDRAGDIVISMNTALSDNRDAISKAFAENKSALEASERQSRKALEASIADSRNTLRPYVYVATLALLGTVGAGQRMQGQGGVINSGRTPATKATVCADLVVLGNANTLDDDYPCPSPTNPHGAGSPIHSIAVIGPNNPPVFLRSPGTTPTVPANAPPNQPRLSN